MATGYFSLVLHAHLPFVRHPEDPTVMEEQWLYEAITGTYLPLLQMFEGLIADNVPYRCTVSLSAPLITMLTDDLLKERYARYLDKLIELADKEIERTRPEPHYQRLAQMYHDRFLLAAPHLALPRRRSGVGVPPAAGGRPRRGDHLDGDARVLPADGPQLGQHPRPGPRRRRSLREALRPPPARHVAGRVRLRARRRRAAARGGDPLLLRRHARRPVRRPPPAYGVYAPIYCTSGVAAFGRDIESSQQVWSAQGRLPRRQALPRLLPRHRLRPADGLHRPVRPSRRAPHLHRHQVPRDHPRPAARQVGLRSRHRARQGRPARDRTSATTACSRSARCARTWIARR